MNYYGRQSLFDFKILVTIFTFHTNNINTTTTIIIIIISRFELINY
jgi:hypothetical protein